MHNSFKILGSGAGPGAPSFFCDCSGCQEIYDNPALARSRSGALITAKNYNVLLDASPDLRFQLIREKINQVDAVFLTHWHYDHFGGLGELEYYVKLKRKKRLPLYLPPSAVDQFAVAFPNLKEVFTIIPWQFGQPHRFDAVSIRPLPANHGIETAGFLVESFDKKLAYFPDTADLPAETVKDIELVDWFICDATFHGENWFPQSHLSIEQAVDLGRKLKAGHTVLTHLSIHYSQPVTAKELTLAIVQWPNVVVGYDGMAISL